MTESLAPRYHLAQSIALQAGQLALERFRRLDTLVIEKKGLQDEVSAADREVEQFIHARIRESFPDDGFLGEEGGNDGANSRIVWVVDPIDGTACFVNNMYAWCLSIGLLVDGEPVMGVVYEPNANELFHAIRGGGAFVGCKPIRVQDVTSVRDGVLGVGFSHRVGVETFVPFLEKVLVGGGMFIRNGSGALMMSYVAAGRLIGYYEPHINSWDCLAGIVLVQEAGGIVNAFLADDGLLRGNPILVSGPRLYDELASATGLAGRKLGKAPKIKAANS